MTALLIAFAAVAMVADLAHAAVALATSLLTDPLMLDTVSWGLILGVVTPLLTALVQQPKWGTTMRTAIGVVVSLIVAVVTCLANGSLSEAHTVLATIAIVLVATQATYKGLWQPSGLAKALELATSPRARHAAQ